MSVGIALFLRVPSCSLSIVTVLRHLLALANITIYQHNQFFLLSQPHPYSKDYGLICIRRTLPLLFVYKRFSSIYSSMYKFILRFFLFVREENVFTESY